MEWLGPFLTGGLAVALVKLIEVVVTRWMDNAAKEKQEQRQDKNVKRLDVETELAKLCQSVNALKTSQQIILHDRIKWLGRGHITRSEISFDDRDDLVSMYEIYHDMLGGNGALESLMADVKKLPLKR